MPSQPTVKELAAALGVSRQQLYKDFRNGCPRGPLEAVRKWRALHKTRISARTSIPSQGGGESPPISGVEEAIEDAKTRFWRHRADTERERANKLAHENQERANKLISREKVELEMSLAFARLRNHLMGIPRSTATLVPGEQQGPMIKKIETVIRRALKELAAELEQMGYSVGDEQ